MVYELRRAHPLVKWLVACLLATFGVSYLFGAWMVLLYAGFSPHKVAATFAEPETAMHMHMPPETTIVVQRAVPFQEFAAQDEQHVVDRNLLVQDTHVHVPMYGVIAAALSVIVLGLVLPRWMGFGLIGVLFAAPWLDFAGMWLTKLVSSDFAMLTILGGWAMAFGYAVVTALAVWQMWFLKKEEAAE